MIFQFVFAALKFVFTAESIWAKGIRFVGGLFLSSALSGGNQPRLSDLKIQTSSYGGSIPRVFGTSVRMAGNVIDKSNLIPFKKKKGGIFGVGGQKYYIYFADVVIGLGEGALPVDGLVRIWADGKVVFDRDARTSSPLTVGTDGVYYQPSNGTQKGIWQIRFYPGTGTQGVDSFISTVMRPGETLPAYRHTAYVVIGRMNLSDYGNRVPNLEFEVETSVTRLGDIVSALGDFANCSIQTSGLDDTVKGYIVANADSAWTAIEPLAGAFSFDLAPDVNRYEAVKRGRHITVTIPNEDLAARPENAQPSRLRRVKGRDPIKHPSEVSVTHLDKDRDYQLNAQRAFRNETYADNKIDIQVPIVLDADEARQIAERTLGESIAAARDIVIQTSRKYKVLRPIQDVIGLTIGGQVEPFRIMTKTTSPNGMIEFECAYEGVWLYTSDLAGQAGEFTSGTIELPGDTVLQPLDAPIVVNEHDDTGFFAVMSGDGTGWHGAELHRALGTGSPLSYDYVADYDYRDDEATIADCDTTLGDGPSDVWDRVSTVTISLLGGDAPESASEENVLLLGSNLAWIGAADGQDGEFIHYATVTPVGSPPTAYTLSDLLRGRYGTEHAIGLHAASERCVLYPAGDLDRADFGAVDWDLTRTYKAISLPTSEGDLGGALAVEFENTGEGKRPLSPVGLRVERDGSNDVTLSCTRRTRLETPVLGGGAVPLGEDVEAYEWDILDTASPANVVRTISTSSPAASYSAAEQTADGLTPGDPVNFIVYQMSGIRGRGRPAQGVG